MNIKNIKIYTLLAFLLMAGGVTMQAQGTKEYYPLIPESGERQWDTRRDFIWGESDYMINWLGEEIELDGVLYRKMHYGLDGSGYYYTGLEGAFREEDKKVYVRGWDSGHQQFNEEMLYYDFNLQVGDSFNVCSYSEPFFIQVIAIEEVEMADGTLRKKFVFNGGWGGDENETWIEGVGSLAGVTHRFDPDLVGSFFSYLQCYFEDDNLVWTDGECWDGVGENAAEQVSVYPNPAKDRVAIEGIEAAEVQVYNALGLLVKTVRGTNEIDLSGLVEGVYLVRIRDEKGRSFWERIIVK